VTGARSVKAMSWGSNEPLEWQKSPEAVSAKRGHVQCGLATCSAWLCRYPMLSKLAV